MKPLAAIAISGGIDSLVAAHLLKQAGHPLLGLHFITGFEAWLQPSAATAASAQLCEIAGARLAPLADQLDLAIEVVDLRPAFRRMVVDDFTNAYARGRTPNPCMVCNPGIKFGELLSHARRRGAEFLATGHYARIARNEKGIPQLCKGFDTSKDQSYFLARLTSAQLASACFPLGEQTKTVTRRIAADAGLQPLAGKESQDICFIQDGVYRTFLNQQPGFASIPGPIVTSDGKRLGTHRGLYRYTVGQRRGIGIPGPEPYYVVRLEPDTNQLVVGLKQELFSSGCCVVEINWIDQPPQMPIEVMARIRYRHQAVAARLLPLPDNGARLRFSAPQKAVTPGQGAVFYAGDRVLGGGWISTPTAGKEGHHVCE